MDRLDAVGGHWIEVRHRPDRGFAFGLLVESWLTLTLAWPFALFVTHWGDCFENCPVTTDADFAFFKIDLVLWVVASVGVLASTRWRHGAIFAVLAAIGAVLVGQGIAGFLGTYGQIDAALMLPGAVTAVYAGFAGFRTLDRPGMTGRLSTGVAIGCIGWVATAAVAYASVTLAATSGVGDGRVLFVAIAVVGLALAVVIRRRQDRRPID